LIDWFSSCLYILKMFGSHPIFSKNLETYFIRKVQDRLELRENLEV
jgi:hypothetical protein